jgi:pectinesterase inhibitor-like protein
VKHADLIQTNQVLLTGTALNVTLASAKSTSAMMSTLTKSQGLKPGEAAAMKDCVEVLSDSVDELRRSIDEMSRLSTSNFELTMSDVQTWVSAALTDQSTCTDGFQEANANGEIKTVVRGRIVQVAQLTSNALALLNKLATSHP